MEFVIFTHSLIIMHILQPTFRVVSNLKGIGLITCKINQTIDSVSHFLIFQGSGCLADSVLQYQTHFALSCISPRVDRSRLAGGVAVGERAAAGTDVDKD